VGVIKASFLFSVEENEARWWRHFLFKVDQIKLDKMKMTLKACQNFHQLVRAFERSNAAARLIFINRKTGSL